MDEAAPKRKVGRPKKILSTFSNAATASQKNGNANAPFSPSHGFSLLEPDGKDLRDAYPELATIPEFKVLSSFDMDFVNWYANPTSPLVISNLPEGDRILTALNKAYKDLATPELRETYLLHNWPGEVESAIARMKAFNPGIRNKAQRMIESVFETINSANDKMKQVIEGLDLGKPESIDKIKNYYMAQEKYIEMLPKLIEEMEKTGIRKKSFTENNDIFSDVLKKVHFAQNN